MCKALSRLLRYFCVKDRSSWDSLAEVPEAVPISDALREELDRRLEAYYADPTSARPWSEIKEELFGAK